MHVSTILDQIDNGDIALPEFQRGYVWNREQVRGLFTSLYRGYPIGGFMMWTTPAVTAQSRGDGARVDGNVRLLLDGQQRITSLYGVVRGKAPQFFEGNAAAFTGLQKGLEIAALEKKLRNEPQLNRKIELRRQLRECAAALTQLTDPAPSSKE